MKKSILLSNRIEHSITLEEYTKNWQNMIDALPYPTILTDTDHYVVIANNAARTLLGYPDNLQNVTFYQLFHRNDASIKNCPTEGCKDEQTEIYEPNLGKHLTGGAFPRGERQWPQSIGMAKSESPGPEIYPDMARKLSG